MDTGKGYFSQLQMPDTATAQEVDDMMKAMQEAHPGHGGWFHVGEIIELKGSRFVVKAVKPKELRLKLLPRA